MDSGRMLLKNTLPSYYMYISSFVLKILIADHDPTIHISRFLIIINRDNRESSYIINQASI